MTITFGNSNDNNDANLYAIDISAGFESQGYSSFSREYLKSDFYYTDTRCLETSITGPDHPPLSTSVMVI
jgi:hypothetical protein